MSSTNGTPRATTPSSIPARGHKKNTRAVSDVWFLAAMSRADCEKADDEPVVDQIFYDRRPGNRSVVAGDAEPRPGYCYRYRRSHDGRRSRARPPNEKWG